ncbi:uncharacterized protein LOC129250776 [Anastrepha obliqua]|uniref:uncharacterized protein LOC129250776 n=1 Tax=Anastrepha obliqua TaxID=95512 RepID=UPI00240A8A28|nr:uncharacterized protein LOC129250776 [Anastrepha obliqua]
MAPQTPRRKSTSSVNTIRRSSPTLSICSLSTTRTMSPLSDEKTLRALAIRSRRFRATLSPIQEEKDSRIHRTARPTISSITRHKYNAHRNVACGICKKDHRLVTCSKYIAMNIKQKFEAVTKHKYCINYLARSHRTKDCTSERRCSTCNGKHHSTLHGYPRLYTHVAKTKGDRKVETHRFTSNTGPPSLLAKQTLIPTAFIRIKHYDKWHKVKALINPTQKLSTISSELVRRLRLPITYLNEYRICHLKIGSLTAEQLRLEAHILISKDLPTRPYEQDISDEIRKRFDHLVLADPSFNRKDHVMIALGADIYQRIIKSGIFHPDNGTIAAQNTGIGWTLTGTIN